jgi:hypothetical protein
MTRFTLLVAQLALFVAPAVASASIVVPAGLQPGDMYQLAFLTSGTIDATSPDISTYNNFVNAQAALFPALTGTDMGVEWFAIASTVNDGDARDNAVYFDVPVFLLNGTTQIASMSLPLYGGVLSDSLNLAQDGLTNLGDGPVWTGSNAAGASSQPLGGSSVTLGTSGAVDDQWLAFFPFTSTLSASLYALSEKLTVPQPNDAIPEPMSGLVWLMLGGGSLSLSYLRRRRETM